MRREPFRRAKRAPHKPTMHTAAALVVCVVCIALCARAAPPEYTSHAALVERMARAENAHVSTFSIGRSVQQRDLRAALCAANGTAHARAILLVANMHGDETLGREAA